MFLVKTIKQKNLVSEKENSYLVILAYIKVFFKTYNTELIQKMILNHLVVDKNILKYTYINNVRISIMYYKKEIISKPVYYRNNISLLSNFLY